MKSIKVIIVAYKLFIKCGREKRNINAHKLQELTLLIILMQQIEKDYDGWMALCNITCVSIPLRLSSASYAFDGIDVKDVNTCMQNRNS